MQFYISLYVDIGRIIPYLQANPYWLKTKNINGLIFSALLLNKSMLTMCFVFMLGFFKEEKKRGCCMFWILIGQWEMKSDVNMVHGKMSDFVSFPLSVFCLVIKLSYFDFESHRNILIFLINENNVRFEYPLSNIVSFRLSFAFWDLFFE